MKLHFTALVAAAAAWAQHQEVTFHLVKDELVPLTVLLQAEGPPRDFMPALG